MAQPAAHPQSTVTNVTNVVGNFVQSWGAKLLVPFSTPAIAPVTATAVLLPIVVSAAGFLLIVASASGTYTPAGRAGIMVVAIDGVPVPSSWVSVFGLGAFENLSWAISIREPITAGGHVITVEFSGNGVINTLAIDPVANPFLDSVSLVVSEVAA